MIYVFASHFGREEGLRFDPSFPSKSLLEVPSRGVKASQAKIMVETDENYEKWNIYIFDFL